MRKDGRRYSASRLPVRKIACFFWTLFFLLTFLVNAWAGVILVPIHPDNIDTRCTITAKSNVPDMTASILETFKTKWSMGAFRRLVQATQNTASPEPRGFWQNSCGPSISYGICTLYQDNNQQAFLRLDLPPPSTTVPRR